MSRVLTLGGAVAWPLDDTLNGAICGARAGTPCTNVPYPQGTGEVGVQRGATNLDGALAADSSPTVVFGYSEGAVVATRWLAKHAGTATAPAPQQVSFILVGNPARKYGGIRPAVSDEMETPSTEYTVLDVAREYDGVADYPDDPSNLLAVANAFAGAATTHTDYGSVDLDTADTTVWQDGNTTYVLVRNKNLPLLAPLRTIGLTGLADKLNDPLKKAVDSGYNRNYPGLIEDPVQAREAVAQARRGQATAPAQPATPPAAARLAGPSEPATPGSHDGPAHAAPAQQAKAAINDKPASTAPAAARLERRLASAAADADADATGSARPERAPAAGRPESSRDGRDGAAPEPAGTVNTSTAGAERSAATEPDSDPE